MANSNLQAAKAAKNDEFYTQYPDIQKEIQAYLDFNPNVFKNKVVYCNCDDPFESNFFKFFANKFQEYGLKKLITTSYTGSPIAYTQTHLPGIIELEKARVLPNRKNKKAAKIEINDVSDLTQDGVTNLDDVKKLIEHDKNVSSILCGDGKYPPGDFRSKECIELLKQADIIVTNPPFSLFREYVKQLFDYNKKFVILSNKGAVIYKEIFPLFQENKLWSGRTEWGGGMWFETTNIDDVDKIIDGKNMKNVPSIWITNIDHGRRHQKIPLMSMEDNKRFNKQIQTNKNSYRRYENYDAIEVPYTNAIPFDYDGVMGVPISFLDKYSPEQFEIIWQASGNTRASAPKEILKDLQYSQHPEDRGGCGVINNKRVYSRILIRHKKETI